jgi:hypothetical protein
MTEAAASSPTGQSRSDCPNQRDAAAFAGAAASGVKRMRPINRDVRRSTALTADESTLSQLVQTSYADVDITWLKFTRWCKRPASTGDCRR